MSFICVICRDLLKISEESSSPRHNQYLTSSSTTNTTGIPNHVSSSTGSISNNVSGRKKEKNNSIVATKCGHLFHYPCLSVWLSQSMNLTTDSKMRCPSCKQLIYIYELVQLFPVENNSGISDGVESIFSGTFQIKMNRTMEQVENLVRDLGKNANGSQAKGNETPTRLQRMKDSPKRLNSTQLAEIVKELDFLQTSIKELSSVMEQHAELGSAIENQSKEICELKSKNEQLMFANEKLKLKNDAGITTTMTNLPTKTKTELTNPSSQTDTLDIMIVGEEAQELNDGLGNTNSSTNVKEKENRRKSVTFLDPFDDFGKSGFNTRGSRNEVITFQSKDLRIGDKVIWYFEGNPEVGSVKWKGFIGSQINVGVEFERQLGLPIKDHNTDAIQCIFKSKPGHGRLIPANELLIFDKKLARSTENSSAFRSSSTECVHSENKTNGINKRVQLCTQQ